MVRPLIFMGKQCLDLHKAACFDSCSDWFIFAAIDSRKFSKANLQVESKDAYSNICMFTNFLDLIIYSADSSRIILLICYCLYSSLLRVPSYRNCQHDNVLLFRAIQSSIDPLPSFL